VQISIDASADFQNLEESVEVETKKQEQHSQPQSETQETQEPQEPQHADH